MPQRIAAKECICCAALFQRRSLGNWDCQCTGEKALFESQVMHAYAPSLYFLLSSCRAIPCLKMRLLWKHKLQRHVV
ncbi:hypothetical protein GQ54DRAFT_8740 [Martensiomyces pterosporus]|nr:hypothetical protein GQ54DRAFT_8740 [Martensiomyces pterosporus]